MKFFEIIEKRRTIRDFKNEKMDDAITIKQKNIAVNDRIHWNR